MKFVEIGVRMRPPQLPTRLQEDQFISLKSWVQRVLSPKKYTFGQEYAFLAQGIASSMKECKLLTNSVNFLLGKKDSLGKYL